MKKPDFTKKFDWGLYPETEKLLNMQVKTFLRNNSFAKKLSKLMWDKTSTHIFDWIDYIVVPEKKVKTKYLKKIGFIKINKKTEKGIIAFKNPRTILFPILLSKSDVIELAIKPENIDSFVKKWSGKIEGKKFSSFRRAEINKQGNYLFTAIERRGSSDFVVDGGTDINEYKKALKIFANRNRKFKTDKQGLLETKKLVKKVLKNLSGKRATDAFFRNERAYWQKKNKSGQIQKKRQDLLGLGWGNHDHHTYRSSRDNFALLVSIFESLGFLSREKFYAGGGAGWGAQILEHPECDIVVFSDVDVTKKEKDTDFSHKGLKNIKKLGTVGLWIALHGESILQSGMHHLEARFDFDKLRKDFLKFKIETMTPFSDFQFLRQAFTSGEKWKVEKKRLNFLLRKGSINKEQYEIFCKEGAIGSHLENLQRRQGFKGFNQKSVTAIIKAVDPRTQYGQGA